MRTAVIIPCFNEQNRLDTQSVVQLLNNPDIDIFLANDGSTDGTMAVLNKLAENFPGRCHVLDFSKNRGKAATIFHASGILMQNDKYSHIAYFDADFSTPPGEILRLLSEAEATPEKFILGSRIMMLNTNIKRKTYRHYIGRFIITLVNLKYKLNIYDTQCGAKIFPVSVAKAVFDSPFKTSWLFDIEIFGRLQKAGLLAEGREIPLNEWQDVDGSKLGFGSSIRILKELLILYTNG